MRKWLASVPNYFWFWLVVLLVLGILVYTL